VIYAQAHDLEYDQEQGRNDVVSYKEDFERHDKGRKEVYYHHPNERAKMESCNGSSRKSSSLNQN
jgi:hypothetical protein